MCLDTQWTYEYMSWHPADIHTPIWTLPTTCNRIHFEVTAYLCTWLISDYLRDVLYLVIVWIFIIALVIYDAHFIYIHMDHAWSVALGQSHFTHLDYLVICYWILATLLHPTIITPRGAPNIWRYAWIFQGVVSNFPNGACCYLIIILHRLFHHVTTAFPLPWLLFGIILPSKDRIHIHMVRWVLGCYCSLTITQSLRPVCHPPQWVWIIFGLWSCLLCVAYSHYFVPLLSSNLGILGLFTPALSCCVSTYISFVTIVVITMPVIIALPYTCAMVHVHLCTDHKKCHCGLSGQCPRRWPVSVLCPWQSAL